MLLELDCPVAWEVSMSSLLDNPPAPPPYSEMYGPGCCAGAGSLRCMAPPQTLDQLGSRGDLSVVMLLSLLLLDLQSKSRAENTLGEHK